MLKEPPLRVVHVSTTDVTGGAALATHRLHHAMGGQDVRSTMFVAFKRSKEPDDSVVEFNAAGWGPRKLGNLLFRAGRRIQRRVRPDDGTFFSLGWSIFGRMAMRQLPPADIYHLHWTVDLLDFRMLPRLLQRAPVVWTFHDMNAFTGGCHYDQGCGRFAMECGACPLLPSSDPNDVTHRVISRKMAALRNAPESRLMILCPSRWMAAETRRSTVFKRFDIEVVPNGIDLETFRPLDRAELRRRYGFGPEERVIFFVAEALTDRRKGWRELEKALAQVAHLPNVRILTVGRGDMQEMQGERFRHLGRLHDAAKICEAYNLADIFVIPTLQDNFPNTVIEALACGTPVIGFATGGVVDAVEHGISGLLAPTGDIDGFARHITQALTDKPLCAAMRVAARARAVEHFGVERQAAACAALYRRMLSGEPAPRESSRLPPSVIPAISH